jgi:hypothetical protein
MKENIIFPLYFLVFSPTVSQKNFTLRLIKTLTSPRYVKSFKSVFPVEGTEHLSEIIHSKKDFFFLHIPLDPIQCHMRGIKKL